MSFPTYPNIGTACTHLGTPLPTTWSDVKASRIINCGMGQTILKEMVREEHYPGWLPVYSASEGEGVFGYLQNPSVRLEAGDLVIGARGSIGKTRQVETSCTCTQTTIWAKVSNPALNSRFLFWAFTGLREHLFPYDKTAIPMLTVEQVRAGCIPVPPARDQACIATFLDHETAKIDALIAEQQRLIELLQEKRQAVISHAVTKGLNPDAPMKDSGVEWLGEVPEHWDIFPVWMMFFLGRGRVISHEDIAQSPGDYPVFSSQTENDGEMGRLETFDFEGDYLTWTTDGANAGSVFRRSGRFNCTNVCGTLKAKTPTRTNLDFALASLRLATKAFVRMDINPKLMNNVMASIKIPIPPSCEQDAITRHLSKETQGFYPLESAIETQLELLQERRSALISAAVTGQIDVRNIQGGT